MLKLLVVLYSLSSISQDQLRAIHKTLKSTREIVTFQSHPAVIEAGKKALDTHGAGLSSVRFICGTMVRLPRFLLS